MNKRLVVKALERFAPRYLWRYRIKHWRIDTGEAEQQLLPWVCDPNKISIDIGAATGTYAAHLLLYSSHVVAFEPRPEAAKALRSMFGQGLLVSVEQVALSGESGTIAMRCPVDRPMLSTIEVVNELTESESHLVDTVHVNRERLDTYRFTPVGFIKIDVEGHESDVLAGSLQTIERERPKLLIEIEHRHNPTSLSKNTEILSKLGYLGYFLLGDKLVALEEFSVERHQNLANLNLGRRTGIYINNFLFLPSESVAAIPARLSMTAGT